MELIFHPHTDLMLEALVYLTQKAGEPTLDSLLKRLARLYADEGGAAHLKEYAQAVHSLCGVLDQACIQDTGAMDRFFRPFSTGQGNLAQMLAVSFYDQDIPDWDAQQAQIIEKFQAFAKGQAPQLSSLCLSSVFEDEGGGEATGGTLMEQLEETSFTDGEKWQILNAVHNPDAYIPELSKLLLPVRDLIAVNLSGLQPLLEGFAARWKDYFRTHPFTDYLAKNLGVEPGDLSVYTVHISPCILNGGIIALSMDDTLKTAHMQIGLGIREGLNVKALPVEGTVLLEGLKALSDKSKLSILALIRDKRAYGQALAKETGLSTATISHHIGALLSCGFIRMERVENRIYYQMDKESLGRFLRQLWAYLLESDGPGPML